jgi:hypothetical protein
MPQYESDAERNEHAKFHEELRQLIIRLMNPGTRLGPHHVVAALLQTAADMVLHIHHDNDLAFFLECAKGAYVTMVRERDGCSN